MNGVMPQPNQKPTLLQRGYITKTEAMKLTGKSLKRFEQAIKAHNIPTTYVPVSGRRPIPTYPESAIKALPKSPATTTAAALTRAQPRPDALAELTTALRELQRSAASWPGDLLNAITAAQPTTTDLAAKQLLTMTEAHRLGWPLATLRELKQRENPPGIRYGRTGRGFRFSADALRRISAGCSTPEVTAHDTDPARD